MEVTSIHQKGYSNKKDLISLKYDKEPTTPENTLSAMIGPESILAEIASHNNYYKREILQKASTNTKPKTSNSFSEKLLAQSLLKKA